MKPEAAAFVGHAHKLISRAERMLAVELNEDSARTAYLACFHIAQAYIFERTDKTAKSHHGVQTEFFRLTRSDGRADVELRRFLSKAYDFKSVADYFIGEDAVILADDAAAAVATAKRFVDHFDIVGKCLAVIARSGATKQSRTRAGLGSLAETPPKRPAVGWIASSLRSSQ